jgi:hypothetical protein
MAWKVVERFFAAGALAVALVLAPWRGPLGAGGGHELNDRLASVEAERDALRARVESLELELAREREARLAREQAWLAYTRAVAELLPSHGEALPAFEVQGAAPEASKPAETPSSEPSAKEVAARKRAEEVRAGLRALLASEAVRGLDLLEVGSVQDGFVGPVVFRLTDGQGRLSGSLFAERLRLEGSRAARSLALVLESGYESHAGERTPFGAQDEPAGPPPWRIPLQGLNPDPWIESLPELFAADAAANALDDGLWNTSWVRLTLNSLLRQDTSSGQLRVKRLGGVELGVLRDVHVEVLDAQGVLEQRIFADRLSLEALGDGVLLRFEGGVHVRGEERTPFLEGGYRVWLPRARAEEWRAAGLPGLVDRPPPNGAAQPPPR